jgi:hypothetical protein
MGVNQLAFDFPATPSVGQVFGNYIWDGEKWKLQGGQALGAVRYDTAQILSAGQQTQARHNIAAPGLDALNYSGMQINGSMDVSQELGSGNLTSVAGVTFSKYILDGWVGIAILPTGSVTFGQTPMAAEVPGLQNSFQFVVGTARASLSGSDTVRINHSIEGYRFARVAWGTSAAVPVTVGFWVRATLSGTYRALMMNSGGATVTPWQSFTLTGGPAFQWITITFPAQTTGTWLTTNGIGAQLLLEMASPSTPNLMATAGNYASITGVIILPGIEAPTAAQSPLIMRPYDQELQTCARYYWKDTGMAAAAYIGPNDQIFWQYPYHVEMRAVPTIAWTGGILFAASAIGSSVAGARSTNIIITADATAGLVRRYASGWTMTRDARL